LLRRTWVNTGLRINCQTPGSGVGGSAGRVVARAVDVDCQP